MIFSPANIMTQLSASERVGFVLFCEVRNGEPNRGGSTDQKNQFAAKVAGLAYFVRGRGFAELVDCHFRRTDSPFATSTTMRSRCCRSRPTLGRSATTSL